MALPRWKRRLIWALSIPLGLSLIGWGMLTVAETRVRKAIQAEEFKLELLGLRAKPLTPGEDAAPDYAKVAAAIRAIGNIVEPPSGGGWSYEGEILPDPKVLSALVAASRKPAFLVPTVRAPAKNHPYRDRNLVLGWCSGVATYAAGKGDTQTLNAVSDALRHMQRQLALGTADFAWSLDGPEPILRLMYVSNRQARQRAWVKERLLRYDVKPLARAYFSGAVLGTRKAVSSLQQRRRPGGLNDVPNWLIERTRLFRLMAEYELLRSWRAVAAVELPIADRSGVLRDLSDEVGAVLSRRDVTPAKYAGNAAFIGHSSSHVTLELDRRICLIGIDLTESFLDRQPMKLTWSASLLVDPSTGAPLRLTAKTDSPRGASFEISTTKGDSLSYTFNVP